MRQLELDNNGRADPFFTGQRHDPTMHLNQGFNNGQPKTRPPRWADIGFRLLMERLHNPGQVHLSNANPMIGDFDGDHAIIDGRADGDCGMFIGEFAGIGQQVQQYLPEGGAIRPNH